MKTFKGFFIVVFLMTAFALSGYSQINVGGTVGADYRNDGFYIEIAPQIGYKYKIFEFGVNPFVLYSEGNDHLSAGIRVYTEATVWKSLFLHAEFQAANNYISMESKRGWVLGLPIGVGWAQPIQDNLVFKGIILWDVLHKDGYSAQKNPIFRVGLVYSL